ncbi:MAG: hypothetical protein FJ011_22675 [Chloroflexi bacterium]|nr:hypothetical protein [Chloroflexota bacterium]
MKRVVLMIGVLACPLMLVLASCSRLLERQRIFTVEEIAGTWQADYSRYGVPDMSQLGKPMRGIETVILELNGTFRQSFSGNGNELTQGAWTLENGDTLHLRGARIYIYGLEFAEALARREARAIANDCHGKNVEINGSKLILCVKPDRNAPGGIVLEHLEAGDPDAPQIVTFYRTSP